MPSRSLDRDAWVRLAVDILAEEGLAGLRVEALAKRLGVTKGSFYWHFKDRQALLDAVLEEWRTGRIQDCERQAQVSPDRAAEQLRHVMDTYAINPNRKGVMIELAVRDWARRDAAAASAVEQVDEARRNNAAQLFRTAGFADEEAEMRALLLYTHAFGLSMMVFERHGDEVARLHTAIAALIAGSPRN
ncbi:TetR/AcrR family transcriptional regulator [Uliginosibacterium sp. H1]|uniref:TetR/AcrR family transcriptional regulator n=1 Tax=Uliginosibacterium sp. H1 TaxID=3114757 RepID=UPI002E183887|nr:TetR/AcrR family transcriptional regulator [Uliginosibacterium sp. H1]